MDEQRRPLPAQHAELHRDQRGFQHVAGMHDEAELFGACLLVLQGRSQID